MAAAESVEESGEESGEERTTGGKRKAAANVVAALLGAEYADSDEEELPDDAAEPAKRQKVAVRRMTDEERGAYKHAQYESKKAVKQVTMSLCHHETTVALHM